MREWKKPYLNKLKEKFKSAKVGKEVFVMAPPSKKRGRPPLLGEKLDKYLQEAIVHMHSRGTLVGTTIVVGTGRGILLMHGKTSVKEFGGSFVLNKEWAKSVLR